VDFTHVGYTFPRWADLLCCWTAVLRYVFAPLFLPGPPVLFWVLVYLFSDPLLPFLFSLVYSSAAQVTHPFSFSLPCCCFALRLPALALCPFTPRCSLAFFSYRTCPSFRGYMDTHAWNGWIFVGRRIHFVVWFTHGLRDSPWFYLRPHLFLATFLALLCLLVWLPGPSFLAAFLFWTMVLRDSLFLVAHHGHLFSLFSSLHTTGSRHLTHCSLFDMHRLVHLRYSRLPFHSFCNTWFSCYIYLCNSHHLLAQTLGLLDLLTVATPSFHCRTHLFIRWTHTLHTFSFATYVWFHTLRFPGRLPGHTVWFPGSLPCGSSSCHRTLSGSLPLPTAHRWPEPALHTTCFFCIFARLLLCLLPHRLSRAAHHTFAGLPFCSASRFTPHVPLCWLHCLVAVHTRFFHVYPRGSTLLSACLRFFSLYIIRSHWLVTPLSSSGWISFGHTLHFAPRSATTALGLSLHHTDTFRFPYGYVCRNSLPTGSFSFHSTRLPHAFLCIFRTFGLCT